MQTCFRDEFARAHRALNASFVGVRSRESLAWSARAVLLEDVTLIGVLAARSPLALAAWRGRTGLSELPVLGRKFDWAAWLNRVQVDAVALRAYAAAVQGVVEHSLRTLHGTGPEAGLLTALLVTLRAASAVPAAHNAMAAPLSRGRTPPSPPAPGRDTTLRSGRCPPPGWCRR